MSMLLAAEAGRSTSLVPDARALLQAHYCKHTTASTLMHARRIVLWTLFACLAACGDLKVRSVAPTVVVPAELEGRWVGTWQSDGSTGSGSSPAGSNPAGSVPSGSVEIRIQQFAGEPLVAITIDNPCLVPRNYDLRITAQGIDLLAEGVSVLRADRVTAEQLVGTYQCDEDQGAWEAEWVESLPTLLDLSGTWEGRIFGGGEPEQPIEVTMVQSVVAGALVLIGEADLPGALPFSLPLRGVVRFREVDFELFLQTEPGFEPQVFVTGIGAREPLTLPVGVVSVLSPTALPFSQALIELVRTVPGQ